MQWVIKRSTDGLYAVSRRLFIHSNVFARRFKTKKQAEAYITTAGFDKGIHTAVELRVQTDDMIDMTDSDIFFKKE
ncbi:hypothetical protein [Ruminococcus sp.]|uniref:hypothetical protein n=1 Tax=Ruminococcus sp. TaxID=41978 RepID=UPI0025E9EA06|nr:hypothetical protein [Ruminococcus sp.]MCR4638336.1 hypothetical protein [Ruminococcus sp.]